MLDNLPPLLIAHLAAACLAIPIGCYQLTARQGTPAHALLGRIYVPTMLVCNLTALATFRPDTPFLFFHFLAFVSLYSLVTGMLSLRRWLRDRKPADLKAHKVQMAYSWLGVMMAGASQVLVNPRFGIVEGFDKVTFWTVFAVVNIVLYVAGTWWIFGKLLKRQLG